MRPAAALAGLAGAAWGVLAGLGALDVIGRAPLHPAEGRAGQIAGTLALGLAAVSLLGALLALRTPAVAAGLLFIATIAGPLAVGAAWIGPATLQLVGAMLALAAAHDPFAHEVRRERQLAARMRTHEGRD